MLWTLVSYFNSSGLDLVGKMNTLGNSNAPSETMTVWPQSSQTNAKSIFMG